MAAWYDTLWPLLRRALMPHAARLPAEAPPPGAGLPSETALSTDLSPLALAYLGDAIYEVYVRARLVGEGAARLDALHQGAVARVRAVTQARVLEEMEPHLTVEERAVVRRARNARPGHVPRGTSPADYHRSTAFEALLGHLLATGQVDRLDVLLAEAWVAAGRGLNGPF